jgi:hypothetical protein
MPPGLSTKVARTAAPGKAHVPQLYVPAFGGHMSYADACKRLVGRMSQVSLEMARLSCVPRTCVFPGGCVPRLELMLPAASAEAGLGPHELGRALNVLLEGGLDAGALGRLLDGLWRREPPTLPSECGERACSDS